MFNSIDIKKFERNSNFYGELNLLLTVKNFDLQSIRNRYLKSAGNTTGRIGSVERRKVGLGGLVEVLLVNGEIIYNNVIGKFKEPRGIAMLDGKFSFSSENKVYILDNINCQTLVYDWFSYIHTIDFSPFEENKIIVSSSGFDALFEFDFKSKEKTFEWFAWENGFDKGIDPLTGEEVFLTRHLSVAKRHEKNGSPYIHIQNPLIDVLPTAKRAAFINSVVYDNKVPNKLLATFFHEGSVYEINMHTGKVKKIIDQLLKPHGAKYFGRSFMVTDTGRGQIILNKEGDKTIINFQKLGGKPPEFTGIEWVQNSVIANSFIIGIDSNRTSFIVIDYFNKKYDIIPYNNNWAIQDAVEGKLTKEQKLTINKLQ